MKKLYSLGILLMLIFIAFSFVNVYGNLSIEVQSMTPMGGGKSDTDGDGIINKYDDCPKEAGSVEANGCPDQDGDFVRDSEDECPFVAGTQSLNGCPDADGDFVQDSQDKCPNSWGLPEFAGCPDSDMDGIEDVLDSCPFVAGDLRYNGCPDRDGDGVIDKVDVCPDRAGVASNDGCPFSKDDPYGDNDQDGVINIEDDCPTGAGPKENRGCPYTDEDNDGVLSNEDLCPKTFGPKENKGCPIIDKEVTDVIDVAFQNLEFQFGKAIIKNSSFSSLKNLASVLNHHQEFKLLVSGHTDNVGSEEANEILSEERAKAVKTFLVEQGTEPTRILTVAYGESKPIASNDSEEGRQANRRVEMTIQFD